MGTPTKLKRENLRSVVFLGVVFVVILILSWVAFGEQGGRLVLAVAVSIAALVHFVVLLRTANPIYVITTLLYIFMAVSFLSRSAENRLFVCLIAVCTGVLFVLFMYVLITRKIKWRYTEVLELAARPVSGSEDGFTPRPFPAGKAEYTKEEIIGFARFLVKHVVAFPYFEKNRVVLVIPTDMFRHLLFLKTNYQGETYISFGFDGDVSVNIAKKDYEQYKEELTFDQLCHSFGDLFREFLQLFKSGKRNKIIETMNALRFVV